MIFLLIGIGFFFFSLQTQAQKVWTMDECIDHALHHAVSIRQQQLQINVIEICSKDVQICHISQLNLNHGVKTSI